MKTRVDRLWGWRFFTLALLLTCGLWLASSTASAHKLASQPVSQGAPASPPDSSLLVSHVTWQGIAQPNASNSTQTITLTLRLAGGGPHYDYTGMTTDASGFFTANVSALPGGDYNYRVKGPRNLANGGVITLAGQPVTNAEMGILWAGDANNDNVVNGVDFTIFKPSFGKWRGCFCGEDLRVDFNNNDVINATDYNLLKMNYGHGGAPLIGP
jgi:hypothetical protein